MALGKVSRSWLSPPAHVAAAQFGAGHMRAVISVAPFSFALRGQLEGAEVND